MSHPLNFAVIGCGMLARQTHLPNLGKMVEARLHTCCDINAENLNACTVFEPKVMTDDYLKAVEDPEVDAIIIATTRDIPACRSSKRQTRPANPSIPKSPWPTPWKTPSPFSMPSKGVAYPFASGITGEARRPMKEARDIFRAHLKEPVSTAWRFERPGWGTHECGSKYRRSRRLDSYQ